jgi:hypothetical protein
MILPCTSRAEQKEGFVNERHAYVRGEEIVILFRTAAGTVVFDISGWFPQTVDVQGGQASYVVDSRHLRAGEYEVRARTVKGIRGGETAIFPLTIAPKPNLQKYPVWHWGTVQAHNLDYWVKRGFNGFRVGVVREPLKANDKSIEMMQRTLEQGVRLGVDIGVHFHPLLWSGWKRNEQSRCLLSTGKRDPQKVYPLEQEVMQHAEKTVKSWVNRFFEYPSFRHAHLSSEYVTPFCLNEIAQQLSQQEIGIDIQQYFRPGLEPSKWGRIKLEYLPESLLPVNGIISDDNSIFRLLTWWWKRGNGIKELNSNMAIAIRSLRPDVLIWHDPYRLSPVYGTHTGLDCISTWTYGHPDIKRLAYTKVLQAAAKRDNLKVMQTITLLVYGRFVMPTRNRFANLMLDKSDKDLRFTNGPDYAREAIWLVLSQRPDFITFFYKGSLAPNKSKQSPSVISPETFDAIGETSRTLIEPYGPAILQCKTQKAKVAVLLSYSAILFRQAQHWQGFPNESILPICNLLMMNHIPFDVLLEEDLVDHKLFDYDILLLPYGNTLAETAHRRIIDFSRKGQVIVADRILQPSIPGATFLDMDFNFIKLVDGRSLKKGNYVTAEEYQARMEELSQKLESSFDSIAKPWECNSKQVILNELVSGSIRYVFVINDKKTYGPRFGRWKLIQEAGIKQIAKIKVKVSEKSAIYDAISKALVEYRLKGNMAELSLALPPAGGKLLAILPEAIQKMLIIGPSSADRGMSHELRIRVVDVKGKSVNGSVPLRIDVTDPLNRLSEYSCYTSTVFSEKNGWIATISFLPAINDLPGEWKFKITDLLSGKTLEKNVIVI